MFVYMENQMRRTRGESQKDLALSSTVLDRIGDRLRQEFQPPTVEPVPERVRMLLDRLRERETREPRGARN